MYGSYEVVEECDGSLSAVLDCNGMKVVNEKTEDEVAERMRALDTAYDKGVVDGIREEKARIKFKLGL